MIQTRLQRLHESIGARIFESSLRDVATGNLSRQTGSLILARAISVFVLATPFLVLAFGVALVLFRFPNIVTIVIGAILLLLGWYLLPRRHRPERGGLKRKNVPTLFGVLDEIAVELGTTSPKLIRLTGDYNAYLDEPMLARGDQSAIGIGLILWEALDNEERVALLAHEIAHRVNGDPARKGLIAMALDVLQVWNDALTPIYDYADEGLGDLIGRAIMAVGRSMVQWLYAILIRLQFIESQRAEYLADALGAKVAGKAAMLRLLEQLTIADTLDEHVSGYSSLTRSRLGEKSAFRDLAERLRATPQDRRAQLADAARATLLTVDATHPPTAYRIAFIEALPDGDAVVAMTVEQGEAISGEWAKAATRQNDRFLSQFERQ